MQRLVEDLFLAPVLYTYLSRRSNEMRLEPVSASQRILHHLRVNSPQTRVSDHRTLDRYRELLRRLTAVKNSHMSHSDHIYPTDVEVLFIRM